MLNLSKRTFTIYLAILQTIVLTNLVKSMCIRRIWRIKRQAVSRLLLKRCRRFSRIKVSIVVLYLSKSQKFVARHWLHFSLTLNLSNRLSSRRKVLSLSTLKVIVFKWLDLIFLLIDL